MASSGPPGVNSPHPSLPARPPPSSISAAPTSTTPTTTYGPSAPPATYGAPPSTGAGAGGAAGPKLGYSRTYAPVGTDAGRGSNANNNYNNNNNSYSQPKRQPQGPPSYAAGYGPSAPMATSYGPQYGAAAQYGPQVSTAGGAGGIGPQAYGPTAPPQIQNPFPAHGPQQPQQQYYGASASAGAGAGTGRGGYRQNNNYGNNNNNNWQGGGSYNNAGAAGAAPTYGPSYCPTNGPNYGPTSPAATAMAYGPDGMPIQADATAAGQEGTAQEDEGHTKEKKTATVYRSGGGKTWTDDSLLEWDPSHLRLFVGNLAGEVTDETLFKAFSRWRSVQKALVKRDKWTKKSRGYGFVSFSDADDFFQAAKEMNGKYIGSHPVTVRKSTTDIKVASFKDESGADKRNHGKNRNNKNKNYNKNNNNNAGGSGDLSASATNSGTSTPLGGAGGASGKNSGSGGFGKKSSGYEPALGPVSSGVHKPKKTKNGLKLLG